MVMQTHAPLDARSLELRALVVDALEAANKGHVGPAMSIIELLRVLYDDFLRYRPMEPDWVGRDRLILSKGHGCLALYAILADKGFFPKEELKTFCSANSRLGGHPESLEVPGVELSTGSLGHGLSVGVGLALAARLHNRDTRVVVILGDGELNEGSIWEGAMSAAHHRLANLTVFVDYNKMQSYGPLTEVIDPQDLLRKWESFGFAAVEVDGHDVDQLRLVTAELPIASDRPTAVISHSTKGRGVPDAENKWEWHFKFGFQPQEITAMRDALTVGGIDA